MKNKDIEQYIIGIGTANIDVYGKSASKIKIHHDLPAEIYTSVGGVTRNILVNYALLGGKAKMMCAIGNDIFADAILNDLKKNGIDVSNVVKTDKYHTSTFMQVQDDDNDMYLALCDMSSMKQITSKYLKDRKEVILNSKLVIFDPSIDESVIKTLISICKDKVPIYVDPISDNYALKLKPHVKYFTCIKPNRSELECLSGIKIKDDKDVYKACESIIKQGTKEIFVSLGRNGILYMDSSGNKIRSKFKKKYNAVNASGAGDAAMAAIIYGYIHNLKKEKTIDYALAAGISAISVIDAVNENISIKALNKIIKESTK